MTDNSQYSQQNNYSQYQDSVRERQQVIKMSPERFEIESIIYQKLYRNKCLNIIEIFDINQNEVTIENCQMTLAELLQKRLEISLDFSKQEILCIIAQIVNGYQHLRSLGIIHRNLTNQSILVQTIKGRLIIKLSDFSLSNTLQKSQLVSTKVGTPIYWAPEIMFSNEEGYDDQCDIYSLGIILHQLCYKSKLHQNFQNFDELQSFFKNLSKQSFKCQQNGSIDQDLINLIEKMIVYDSHRRISWDQLARIPTLQQPYKLLHQQYLIDLTQKLGSGMQGVIYLTIDLKFQTECCAKAIDRNSVEGKRELEIYFKFQGNAYQENIIKIFDCCVDKNLTYVIMEKCDEDIKSYFEKNDRVDDYEIFDFLHQIVNGYIQLRHYGIIHRDLKPENILIKHEIRKKRVKIIDFGVSKLQSATNIAKTIAGTPIYSAPEVLAPNGNGYTDKCDIYSLGTMLYQFVFKKQYYNAYTLQELINFQQGLQKKPFKCESQSKFNNLIEQMLIYDPAQRISWNELQSKIKKQMSNSQWKLTDRESILNESIPSSILKYLDCVQIFSSKLEQELLSYYQQTTQNKDVIWLIYFLFMFSQAALLDCQEIFSKNAIHINGETYRQDLTQTSFKNQKLSDYIDELQEQIEFIDIQDEKFQNYITQFYKEAKAKRLTFYDVHYYFKSIYKIQKANNGYINDTSIKLRYYLEKMYNIFDDYPLNNIQNTQFLKLSERIQQEDAQKQYLEQKRI